MKPWLLAYMSPEGSGGYALINGDCELDAVRTFRLFFGYAFTLQTIQPAP